MTIELITQIFELCIFPLLTVLTTYAVKWIKIQTEKLKSKSEDEKEKKYIDLLDDTISNCVIATTQTYVDSLKKQGSFDAEAQKEAFNTTYQAVMTLLTEEAIKYLNQVVGDLQLYITSKIETEVKLNKQDLG